MPTPFDQPVTTPKPTPFQNIMGAFGVTWGQDQNVAQADAARLDKERQANQQAAVWGPLYTITGKLASENPQWGADKVMLEVLKSPEWLNATGTPNFDHANAGKNLYEIVKSTRPIQPELTTVGQNGIVISRPGQGSAETGTSVVARGGQNNTQRFDSGEIKSNTYTPGGLTNPDGSMQQPQGGTPGLQSPGSAPPQGAPAMGNTPTVPQMRYRTEDGEPTDQPAVPWSTSVHDTGNFNPTITQAAEMNGLPPDYVASILNRESRFQNRLGPMLKNGQQAIGLGQILPSTWMSDIAPKLGFAPGDINDDTKNIQGSAYYLGEMVKKYDGDFAKATMAYNWGPGNVDKWIKNGMDWAKVPRETKDYLQEVTGGRVPIPKYVAEGPVRDLKTSIETMTSPDKEVSQDEFMKVMGKNKAMMFSQAGMFPWIKKQFDIAGRQLAPDITPEWYEATNTSIAERAQLEVALANYGKLFGSSRLKVMAEKALGLMPGGINAEPLQQLDAAISLRGFMAGEHAAAMKRIDNAGSRLQYNRALDEVEKIEQVQRALPSMEEMTNMRKLWKNGVGLEKPATVIGGLIKRGGDVLNSMANSLPDGTKPGQAPRAPVATAQPAKAPALGQGGPALNTTSTGVKWNIEQ